GRDRGEKRHERLVRGEVRVLLEEVVLGRPRVLEAGTVGGFRPLDLVHQAVVLGVLGILVAQLVRHVQAVEDPELHGIPPMTARRERTGYLASAACFATSQPLIMSAKSFGLYMSSS